MGSQFIWEGEVNRDLAVRRPCPCGTCTASQPDNTVGFLTGSDGNGMGFTVWITNEAVYQALQTSLPTDSTQAHWH